MNRRLSRLIIISVTFFLFFASLLLIKGFQNLIEPVPFYTFETFTFRDLKGGSPLGYKLAYIGMAILVSGQFFSIRKRTGSKYSRWIGSVRFWFRMHVLTGSAGTLLLLVHAGFPYSFAYLNPLEHLKLGWGFEGLIGIRGLTVWLLLATIMSGFIGGYLDKKIGWKPKLLKYWRMGHITAASTFYLIGMIHVTHVVWFRYIAG